MRFTNLDRMKAVQDAIKAGSKTSHIDSIKDARKRKIAIFAESPKVNNYTDSTFIKVGQNIQEFYKDSSNVDVEITPFYEDYDKFVDKTSSLNKKDDIVILGHSGDKLGGIDNTQLAGAIKDSPAENCYLGSCSFDEYIEPYKELKDKNVYYRPTGAWWGFNKHSKDFLTGMFSRDFTGKRIVEPEKGFDYDIYNSNLPK